MGPWIQGAAALADAESLTTVDGNIQAAHVGIRMYIYICIQAYPGAAPGTPGCTKEALPSNSRYSNIGYCSVLNIGYPRIPNIG